MFRRHLSSVYLILFFCCLLSPSVPPTWAAGADSITAETLRGLELRGIGPALMGGRIADIVIHPERPSTWYVAVGSGGVWKTENAGTTWTPIFDDQPSYSIGCVTLDPGNPETVWVGTGENVSGRHVGWGDGVYRSRDGGTSWEQMGLEASEHIGKILVDPRDGNVVWVAAEGPLWASGGDRGLFKTTDGGANWRRVLEIDEDTGVTDVVADPSNPDVLYAAAYQRRRHVWSLLAGGPGSGIYKSTDGGESWRRLSSGLPAGDMGKIGLAVTAADPSLVYATIEADEKERGFYQSRDGGESWEKRNSYISNGTGPHYYQEIVASPHDAGTVYQMDVFLHVTRDGGATFQILGDGRQKHSDNHALVIDNADPKHLIAGTDASLYESFDDGATWRQFENLPISQFYKLALDSAQPFYNILGGAQDLGTLLGPSRNNTTDGIRNRDWYVPLGADGYACAFDPENPDIVYMEWQRGSLVRYDRGSEEALGIQPQPSAGDPPERWNWDAPLVVSPHSPTRVYFGSQRLWRSDDRGDSWTPVSGDLTRDQNRYKLEMAGRVWSIDSLYDNGAMSWYGTLTTVDESPLVEGLLYAGTDDGLVQVSEDGGASWRATEFADISKSAFVSDVKASLHDPDVVFAVLDAHKTGDFQPHVLMSADRGRSWSSIASDLPARGIVWSIVQDHVVEGLLFAGTEFGLYTSLDGGGSWIELEGGVPTISFRDVEIQRREDDLVGATFGRGFYLLDDYSALREIAAGALAEPMALFPVRDAWWFVPYAPGQAAGQPSRGSSAFTAPNPPFGAMFTYHVRDSHPTLAEARRETEGELREAGANVPFPGWDRLTEEGLEEGPRVLLTVRDAEGSPVRRLSGPAGEGIHRVSWDLRLPPSDPIDLEPVGFQPPWAGEPRGPLAPPGRYRVELALLTSEGIGDVGEAREFEVKPVAGASLAAPDYSKIAAFQATTAELLRRATSASAEITRAGDRLRHLAAALLETPGAPIELFRRQETLEADLAALGTQLRGDRIRGARNEPSTPSILRRAWQVAGGHWDTRQAPTATQRLSLELAQEEFAALRTELLRLLDTDLPAFEADMESAGAPWTPGRRLPPG